LAFTPQDDVIAVNTDESADNLAALLIAPGARPFLRCGRDRLRSPER
jgi:hypothetical protein